MLMDKIHVEVPGRKDLYQQEDISMDGLNVLHLAAQYSIECLELILNGPLMAEAAAVLDDGNDFGDTALHLAASNLDPDCTKWDGHK